MALGKKAAPYIKTQAKKMMPENMTKSMTTKDQSGRSKVDDVIEVAGAGIKGMVWYMQATQSTLSFMFGLVEFIIRTYINM